MLKRAEIPGEPPTVTAQQKGVNRKTGRYYKPAELRDAEAKYLAYARAQAPEHPMDGPVKLAVTFRFLTNGSHQDGEPKTTKPDTDNMLKALKDALTKAGWWHDDAQVWVELTSKIWSTKPGISIQVWNDE